ncbi:2-phosphosulfolactate phosphatase [Kribbella sandramycini]|uniref:Probable 2-phosphosulfolactate phosphatase n=1 Tax=Kribbella sandramycini TaxID=60450 RepID=A0A7Y4KZC0_9ACTN|nr:2-phosphosulfolactate phosphatase [Kribbella sandramycini]NOL41439.1 2-phosphosulfolactate phosphatase [Kribbella sandramycini]
MTSPYAQHGFGVGFDWGPAGADAVPGDIVAVVDVLSFTTAVTVAADLGIDVYPYRWRDETAVAYAAQHDAALAVGRSQAGPDGVSLSPVTIRRAQNLERLVLPSPNGSTISQQLSATGATVIAVSLRNRLAAAEWVRQRPEARVTAIAAGERWRDGSLRPAVEDLWGAGGFLSALRRTDLSPEAGAAVAAYEAVASQLPTLLHECAGGRELAAIGYDEDVRIAAELDQSRAVPVLQDGTMFRST